MQIDLSELFPAVGMKKTVEVPFERKEFRWNGNVYPVTEAGPVGLELSRTGSRITGDGNPYGRIRYGAYGGTG